jgi:alpha-D-ribose 1-methylphosphonate 5-triphosphate diphosphatase
MAESFVVADARLVLPDAVTTGTLVVRDGMIHAIDFGTGPPGATPPGATLPGALDFEGDYLLPGAVDLHTDNLERQVEPRSAARWPSRSALMAHDAQCAAAGITTVLDALCLGDLGFEESRMRTAREGVADLDAMAATGLLKCEHFLHLRCELPAADMLAMFDPLAGHPLLRMVSLMDHSPGVGQYADLERYRALRRRSGADEAQIERRMADIVAQRERMRGPNRHAVLARLAHGGVALASHDDRTAEEIEENAAAGIRISEFPVSLEAARAARSRGMKVIAGAPNIVRGGSHSGNVAAADLVRAEVVDIFASDYVPAAVVEAAFAAHRLGVALPRAVAMISSEPADVVGLTDRGRLAPGQRADFLRVRVHEGQPVIRAVWRGGGGGGGGAGLNEHAARYAIYWAPAATEKLWAAGAAWLGRDPEGRRVPIAPDVDPGLLARITEAPAQYGFHATLKPPMRLHREATPMLLRRTLAETARTVRRFALPPLQVTELDGFLCLRETQDSAPLQALCDAMVAGLDHLRAPPSARELERRRAVGLSEPQEFNLQRWGYPYVFGQWFFHMTLSRRLDEAELEHLRPMAEAFFREALAEPVMVEDVCLFEQSAPGLPFWLTARAELAR